MNRHSITNHDLQPGDTFTRADGSQGVVMAVIDDNTVEVDSAPVQPRRRSYTRWDELIGGLQLLTMALGLLCLALLTVVIGSPYLLGRWLWCKVTGRPW